MALEAHPTALTSRTEVEEIFGELAVELRIDDSEDSLEDTAELEALTQAITEGSDIAYELLLHIYTAAALETSRWVHRRVAYIVCHILSRRRGNAAQFSLESIKAIEDFERIRMGLAFIPRLSTADNYEPSLSNQGVDYHYARSKLRTDRQTAQGGTKGSIQPLDDDPLLGWYW